MQSSKDVSASTRIMVIFAAAVVFSTLAAGTFSEDQAVSSWVEWHNKRCVHKDAMVHYNRDMSEVNLHLHQPKCGLRAAVCVCHCHSTVIWI